MTNAEKERRLGERFGAVAIPRQGESLWFNYTLNGWTIWQIRPKQWQCAQLINGHYTNHNPQFSLNEALIFCRDWVN